MKYGKKPAAPRRKDLLFGEFEPSGTLLKEAPVGFDHSNLYTDWGMLGNDRVGDCVEAAACHETMLWNKLAGVYAPFGDKEALTLYSEVAGYNPNDPNTDQGTDVHDSLNYRRATGVADANGKLHQIGGYVSIEPGNTKQILQGLYIFDVIEIGFNVPDYAEQQFNDGKPWTRRSGQHQIVGGHDVFLCGRPTSESFEVITWGRRQRMSFGFFHAYCDEAYGILSIESLVNGKTKEGYDIDALRRAISSL